MPEEGASTHNRVVKFEPAKASEDELLLGMLTLRPLTKKSGVVKVYVRRTDDLSIKLGEYTVQAEELADFPWKGMPCTASWSLGLDNSAAVDAPPEPREPPDGKPLGEPEEPKKPPKKDKRRRLVSLTFETLEVRGKIEQIEGDVITLKVTPLNDKEWPDIALRQSGRTDKPTGDNKPKRVARRALKLKLMDEVTKYVDGSQQPIDLGDFQIGQDIEATVAYGSTKSGVVVKLRAPGLQVEPRPDEQGRQAGRRGDLGGTRRGGRAGTRRGGGGI